MFKKGGDLHRPETETQGVLCHNEADDGSMGVYFACCNENCECVYPALSGADKGANIAPVPSAPYFAGTNSNVALATIEGTVGVGAAAATTLLAMRENRNTQEQVFQQALEVGSL